MLNPTGDIDGDGDTDVVASFETDVVWYDNTDGTGNFQASYDVATFPEGIMTNIVVEDMDGDGDLDIMVGHGYQNAIVEWFENIGGRKFGSSTVVSDDFVTVYRLSTGEIDGDGQPDVVVSTLLPSRLIMWFGHRVVGDANEDGVFDSADLVQVFQIGEYEDGYQNNSTYAEGDWNGDREFDSGDFVLAFQSGNYADAGVAAHDEVFAKIGAAVNKAMVA